MAAPGDEVTVSPNEETHLTTSQPQTSEQYETIRRNHNDNQTEDSTARVIGRFLLRVFFCLTCQYIPRAKYGKGCSCAVIIYAIVCTTIFGMLINLWSTGVLLGNWAKCPLQYYGICFSLELHSEDPNNSHVPDIVLKDVNNDHPKYLPGDLLNVNDTRDKLQEFTDFAKIVLQFSSASSSFSYIIFVIALWCLYIKPHCKNLVTKEQVENGDDTDEKRSMIQQEVKTLKPLHPFDDDPPKYPGVVHNNSNHCQDNCPVCNITRNQDDDTTTQLGKEEVRWFTFFLLLNILVNVSLMVIFIYGQYHHNPPNTIEGDKKKTTIFKNLEIFSVSGYFYSLFCTLSSCFIFSKIMYGIQRKCSNLYNYLGHINQCLGNENSNNKDTKDEIDDQNSQTPKINLSTEQRFSLYLQQCDNNFVDVAVKTLKMFELWFFIHWILYIVSSFLSVSLLLDAIQLTIQATLPHPRPGVHFNPLEMIFLTLFATSNCIFFLYPCLRAAAVTEARKKLIQRINRSCSDDFPNIPTILKKEFIGFLKGQKFGFRLNILCAHIFFNLNIAYISIFISLLGILIRLSSNI